MNASRFGTQIKIDIRLALLSLGRDPYIRLDRIKIEDLQKMFGELRAEQHAVGGILKSKPLCLGARDYAVRYQAEAAALAKDAMVLREEGDNYSAIRLQEHAARSYREARSYMQLSA